MNREIHVRFCESLGVRFPCATHPRLHDDVIELLSWSVVTSNFDPTQLLKHVLTVCIVRGNETEWLKPLVLGQLGQECYDNRTYAFTPGWPSKYTVKLSTRTQDVDKQAAPPNAFIRLESSYREERQVRGISGQGFSLLLERSLGDATYEALEIRIVFKREMGSVIAFDDVPDYD